MSRSGYSDDYGSEDPWGLIRYRGAVTSALRGTRGQAFLREALAALDAMPIKALAAESLVTPDGEFCTLGVVGAARGVDMSQIDAYDPVSVSGVFGIAEAMAREIVYMNDEGTWSRETADQRWQRMRDWVAANIKPEAST